MVNAMLESNGVGECIDGIKAKGAGDTIIESMVLVIAMLESNGVGECIDGIKGADDTII